MYKQQFISRTIEHSSSWQGKDYKGYLVMISSSLYRNAHGSKPQDQDQENIEIMQKNSMKMKVKAQWQRHKSVLQLQPERMRERSGLN
jgi:hypothetical protein